MVSRNTVFRNEWLVRDDGEGNKCSTWLSPYASDTSMASCTKCNKTFHLGSSGFSAVQKHASGQKHKKKMEVVTTVPINTFFKSLQGTSKNEKNPPGMHATMQAELRLALFTLEHSISFLTMDHSDVFAEMFKDSDIASKMKCHRTKLTYLCNDALAPQFRQELVLDIQRSGGYYSLSLDESNDTGVRKFLQILVSYVSKDKGLIVAPFKTISLSDGTAETLTHAVVAALVEHELSLSQCVSIMTDGPVVMVGNYNGFHTRMRELAPHLLPIATCTLHVVSNAVRHACEELASQCEALADNVFSYFHYTSRWTRYTEVKYP